MDVHKNPDRSTHIPVGRVLSDVMDAVLPLQPGSRCREALHRFKSEKGRQALPVVQAGVPIGILGRSRLVEALARDPSKVDVLDLPVSRIMRMKPLSLEAATGIELAAEALEARGELLMPEGLIVTRDRRYVGIASLKALFSNLRADPRNGTSHAEDSQLNDQLAMVAHEIRTPLSGISGLVGLLSETRLDEEGERIASQLAEGTADLGRLLDDLIEMVRLKHQDLRLSAIDVDLDAFANDLQAQWAGAAATKRLSLKVAVRETGPGRIRVDAARLKQALGNLIGNAIKFTDKGRVEVALASVRTTNGVTLKAEVRDTGPGVPAAFVPDLFKPFSRGTPLAKPGSGLGLSIVRGLVEKMGGDVQYAAGADGGAVFSFSIRVDASSLLDVPEAPRAKRQSTFTLGRVLVAEDHPVNRNLISRALAQGGWQVDAVSTGLQALRRAEELEYQAMLIDLRLPEMGGLDVVRRLRAQGIGLPVLAVTADTGSDTHQACLTAGCQGVIAKPFSAGVLVARLADLIMQDARDIAPLPKRASA